MFDKVWTLRSSDAMLVEGRQRERHERKGALWANGLFAGEDPRDGWGDMAGFCRNLEQVQDGSAKYAL